MPPQKLAQAIDITSRSGDDGLRDSNKGSDCPTKHLNPSNKMSHQGKKLSEEVQMAQREKDIEMRSFIHEKAQKVKLENKILELQILKSEYELTNMQNEKIKSDEIKAKKTNYELKKLKLDNEKTDNEIRYLQLKNIKLGLEIEDLKQKMANNKWNISEVYKF